MGVPGGDGGVVEGVQGGDARALEARGGLGFGVARDVVLERRKEVV